MSLVGKINRFFNGYDDDDETSQLGQAAVDPQDNDVKVPQGNHNNMTIIGKSTHVEKKIMIFEPRVFSDVKQISTRLLEGQAAIINFEKIDDQQTHRVVDFLSGVVFAIDGKIERIGEEIFLCTPPDFSVEGTVTTATKIQDF